LAEKYIAIVKAFRKKPVLKYRIKKALLLGNIAVKIFKKA